MMYTVDASVWVNGFDRQEPGHEISRQFLQTLAQRQIEIVAPLLLLVEVAGAISRTRKDSRQAEAFAFALSKLPNMAFISLERELAEQAVRLASLYALRGADAVYAAVAQASNCTLVSLDNEHLTRLKDVAPTLTPLQALTVLGVKI